MADFEQLAPAVAYSPLNMLEANESFVEYPTQKDVKKFQKSLNQRLTQVRQQMLYKQQILADQFTMHEMRRRVDCTYTIGNRNRKKNSSQIAEERRINEILYKDWFDRMKSNI